MKSIAFLSQKGGVGKTTLAVHCSVEAERQGDMVVVIDTDPQGSATSWSAVREKHFPIVATAEAARLIEVFGAAGEAGAKYCIVDSAPHSSPDAVQICKSVGLVLIPVRPAAFDLSAASQTVKIVQKAGVRAAFILSACPFRAPEIAEARSILAQFGLPVCPIEITERRAYSRAVSTGSSVAEFDPEGKAAAEVGELWAWITQSIRSQSLPFPQQ